MGVGVLLRRVLGGVRRATEEFAHRGDEGTSSGREMDASEGAREARDGTGEGGARGTVERVYWNNFYLNTTLNNRTRFEQFVSFNGDYFMASRENTPPPFGARANRLVASRTSSGPRNATASDANNPRA